MRRRLLWTLLACGLLAAASASAAGNSRRARCAHRAHAHKPRRCRARHRTAPRSPTTPSGGPSSSASTPTQQPATGSAPSSPSGGSGSSTPPTVTHVQVSAVEYHYTLSRSTVPAGKVVFEFVDDGQDEHNLNVGTAEGELALSFATAQPKAVSDQAVVLRKGVYTLFCSLPEHEAKGMKATLTVE